jgi:hypothetical protein
MSTSLEWFDHPSDCMSISKVIESPPLPLINFEGGLPTPPVRFSPQSQWFFFFFYEDYNNNNKKMVEIYLSLRRNIENDLLFVYPMRLWSYLFVKDQIQWTNLSFFLFY